MWLISLFSAVGLATAFDLVLRTIADKTDSHAFDSCAINSVINCATTAHSRYAYFWGVPVALYGLLFFEAALVIGIVLLCGYRCSRWQLWGISLLTVAGVLFSYRLLFYSYFGIGALCPYCLVMDFSITVVLIAWFVYIKKAYPRVPQAQPTPK
ncbi:hypothetical protein KGQ71_00925 [Patescibacteria group bacterium]|nr:hypothetical protein [Patescibacteria group bacterium]